MLNLLIVGAGGFIGTLLRYLVNLGVYRMVAYPLFPYSTLIVNLIGCLLIGWLSGLAEKKGLFSQEMRIFIFIGILGGFTTFSSFGYDTFGLLRDGQIFLAITNVMTQVLVGLIAVWAGFYLAKLF